MTGCQCTEAGWCERHQIQKSARLVYLCQTDEKYWSAWETGHGPKQGTHTGASKQIQPPGPGTELRKMLGCCGWAHTTEMNAWGVDGCRERAEQIVAWLVQCGNRNKSSIDDQAARRLLKMAIERAAVSVA